MELKSLTNKNYEDTVILSPIPVVIDMYAEWCKPNSILENTLAELDKEYGEYIKIVKMNVETQPELTEMFEIESIPVTIMMTGGVITKKIYGIPPKEQLIEELELKIIKDFKDRGINYHPKRNFIPNYIRNEY